MQRTPQSITKYAQLTLRTLMFTLWHTHPLNPPVPPIQQPNLITLDFPTFSLCNPPPLHSVMNPPDTTTPISPKVLTPFESPKTPPTTSTTPTQTPKPSSLHLPPRTMPTSSHQTPHPFRTSSSYHPPTSPHHLTHSLTHLSYTPSQPPSTLAEPEHSYYCTVRLCHIHRTRHRAPQS